MTERFNFQAFEQLIDHVLMEEEVTLAALRAEVDRHDAMSQQEQDVYIAEGLGYEYPPS